MPIKKIAFEILTITFLLNSTAQSSSQKVQLEVTKKVLANGIVLLIQENHKIPLVSYQSWFRIGSRNEITGKTGLAHLFEHLMFTGTPRFPANQFEKILEKSGVSHNAFTTHDCTVYHEDLAKDKLELVMDLESDRLKNLTLSQEIFDSEKKVVQEERLMRSEQSLEGMMNEKLWALAFEKHPYKNPVIGWPQDIENLTLNDALGFFKTHYIPANLIISISGDVNAQTVIELTAKYYGDIKTENIQTLAVPADVPLEKEKKIEVWRDVRAERLLMGYRIGHQGEVSSYALDLAAMILAQGKTSRLYKKLLVEAQSVTSIEADAQTPRDDGLFEIEASLKVGANMNQVQAVIDGEMKRLQTTLVSPSELLKTKRRMLRDTYGSLLTTHGRAHNFALNELMSGTYTDLFNDLDKYENVTPEDIRLAAKKYFNPTNRVIVELKAKK